MEKLKELKRGRLERPTEHHLFLERLRFDGENGSIARINRLSS
jgi:hypothetical protein